MDKLQREGMLPIAFQVSEDPLDTMGQWAEIRTDDDEEEEE
jgi:hypothetical protein